jgi:hypothetical protein
MMAAQKVERGFQAGHEVGLEGVWGDWGRVDLSMTPDIFLLKRLSID